MTEGQKMIWAAVWAAGYRIAIDFEVEPGSDIHDIHDMTLVRLRGLAGYATDAALALDKDLAASLAHNYGPDSRALKCVLEMLR